MRDIDTATLESEIREIVAKIFEISPTEISSEKNFIEDLGGDSMMVLEIMVALDKKYNINISDVDLPKLLSVKHAVKLVSDLLSK